MVVHPSRSLLPSPAWSHPARLSELCRSVGAGAVFCLFPTSLLFVRRLRATSKHKQAFDTFSSLARSLSLSRSSVGLMCSVSCSASKGKESQTNTIIKIKLYLIVNELSCVSSPFNLAALALASRGKTDSESQ